MQQFEREGKDDKCVITFNTVTTLRTIRVHLLSGDEQALRSEHGEREQGNFTQFYVYTRYRLSQRSKYLLVLSKRNFKGEKEKKQLTIIILSPQIYCSSRHTS